MKLLSKRDRNRAICRAFYKNTQYVHSYGNTGYRVGTPINTKYTELLMNPDGVIAITVFPFGKDAGIKMVVILYPNGTAHVLIEAPGHLPAMDIRTAFPIDQSCITPFDIDKVINALCVLCYGLEKTKEEYKSDCTTVLNWWSEATAHSKLSIVSLTFSDTSNDSVIERINWTVLAYKCNYNPFIRRDPYICG